MIRTRRLYQIKEEDRQFADYIPPFSILVSGIIFLVGTTVAILTYHTANGGYDFFTQFFSELGLRHDYVHTRRPGVTELRLAPDNPEIFNFTVIISGMLIIPFFIFSYRQMRNSNRFSNLMLLLAIVSGILTGPFLIGVGIFDLSRPDDPLLQSHGFWVAGLYLGILVASFTWYLMLLSASNLPYTTTKWIWQDYILLALLVFFASINILDGARIFYVEDVPLLNTYPIETYQKVIPYLFFIYFGLIVGIRLTKTKYDNTPVIHDEGAGHFHKKGSDDWYCTNCGAKNNEGAERCAACNQVLDPDPL